MSCNYNPRENFLSRMWGTNRNPCIGHILQVKLFQLHNQCLCLIYLLGKMDFPSSFLYSSKLATWVVSCISNPMRTNWVTVLLPPFCGYSMLCVHGKVCGSNVSKQTALTTWIPGQLTRGWGQCTPTASQKFRRIIYPFSLPAHGFFHAKTRKSGYSTTWFINQTRVT